MASRACLRIAMVILSWAVRGPDGTWVAKGSPDETTARSCPVTLAGCPADPLGHLLRLPWAG